MCYHMQIRAIVKCPERLQAKRVQKTAPGDLYRLRTCAIEVDQRILS